MPREIGYCELERAGSTLSSEETLFVLRLKANEDAAYDELVRSYHTSMYQVAYRMLGDSAEASDVVQDIFLKVFRNIGGFRGQSALKTWMFRIALSEILNRRRFWKRRFRASTVSLDDSTNGKSIHVRDSDPGPQRALESKEREQAIQGALAKLSEDHRSILILRDIEGFSYTEIAEIAGISIGTVKSRLARARSDMKKSLMRHLSVQRIQL
jgi:RNA polymerase sigma-70 factor (ECF subfamily)